MSGAENGNPLIGFATDIRPLFTQTDINHMMWFCDLSKYGDVKTMLIGFFAD
ncbi:MULTISPECIES: hypothetical protein [unclassified Bradyrhizobium]|uniref:hypothetical protein n=1 Tax=unclassified Bradyrhizobium TaxID=2631580 RepID=UPI0020B23C4D|nr:MULTISPECIES: hypothetical protein [unclassified Bradyrhizobium]MCP3402854.1 hypothetical protein [Bradyrhizobium sp. CCGB20]MCP3411331.1 hypothetical protein [Bradyrhizobium sp. CCGB01]